MLFLKLFRPKLPEDFQPDFIKILEKCWDSNTKNRPTASDVGNIINNLEISKIIFTGAETVLQKNRMYNIN
jgi:hypothetical protein